MNYIIDANNLAGTVGLLDEDDFDKLLIEMIQNWLGDKEKIVVLVFDSLDPLGDRLSLGNLEVLYSPRDAYYKSADDKIIEIFRQWADHSQNDNKNFNLNIIKRLVKDDLVFVSDDFDLRQKVLSIQANIAEKIKLMRNDEFVDLLFKDEEMEKSDVDNRGLDDATVDRINDELFDLWGDG